MGYNFRLDEFMGGFNTISLKLKEMYQVSVYFVVFVIYYLTFVSHAPSNLLAVG